MKRVAKYSPAARKKHGGYPPCLSVFSVFQFLSGSYRVSLHLFQAYGVELEYMIVDRATLAVRPGRPPSQRPDP